MRKQARRFDPTLDAAAAAIGSALVPGGLVLPCTDLLGPTGYPVVELDRAAIEHRIRSDMGPALRLETAERLASQERPEAVPSPLRLLAFIGVSKPERAGRELAGIRAMCQTILLTTGPAVQEPLLSEFDYLGITVAASDANGIVDVLVRGEAGPLPGSDLHRAWRRHREEQVFSLVLTCADGSADRVDVGR